MATAQYDKQYVLDKARKALDAIGKYRADVLNAFLRKEIDLYNAPQARAKSLWYKFLNDWPISSSFSAQKTAQKKIDHPDYVLQYIDVEEDIPKTYTAIAEMIGISFDVFSWDARSWRALVSEKTFLLHLVKLCNTTNSPYITLNEKEVMIITSCYVYSNQSS